MSRDKFADRHIGPSENELVFMLKELNQKSLGEFISKVVPQNIVAPKKLVDLLPGPVSEVEVIDELRSLATENRVVKSLIGMGYYGTHVPPVILRNEIGRAHV